VKAQKKQPKPIKINMGKGFTQKSAAGHGIIPSDPVVLVSPLTLNEHGQLVPKAERKQKVSTKPKKKQISIPKLKKAVQAKANLYARLRDCFGDAGTGCISCGKWTSFEKLDGGHFIPTTSSAIRFDERNINAQCQRCNRFLHSNPRHYLRGMYAKYGEDVVHDLEAREFEAKSWSREELLTIRQYYADKIKRLQRGEPPEIPGSDGMGVLDVFKDIPKAGKVS
jgi:hypothetical protein